MNTTTADTWGIPGWAFLLLYVALLVVVPVLWRLSMRRLDRAGTSPKHDEPATDPAVEDVALLAGGRARVVQASIARLVDAGVLRVARDRELSTTGAAPRGELDAAVVADVARRPRATGAVVVATLKTSPAVRTVEAGAVARGLLHPPREVRRRSRVAALALFALAVLGVARIAAGLAGGKSVGFLIFLVLGTFFGALVMRGVETLRPTRRGTATLRATREQLERAPTRTAGGPALVGVAALVAVGGLAMHPDPEVSALLAAPSGGGAGGSSDGVTSDGGSSCGGSSCGGGGCGGGGCGG